MPAARADPVAAETRATIADSMSTPDAICQRLAAQRAANGEFARAPGDLRQRKRGRIGDGDQEQEDHRTENQKQSAAIISNARFFQVAHHAVQPRSVAGYWSPNSFWTAVSSSRAWVMVTPGFNRPTPEKKRDSRMRIRNGFICAGR